MPHPIQTIESDNTKVYKPETQLTQNSGYQQTQNIPTNFQIYPQYDEDYNLIDYNLVDLNNNKTYSKSIVDTYFLQDNKIANTIQDLKSENINKKQKFTKIITDKLKHIVLVQGYLHQNSSLYLYFPQFLPHLDF